MYIVIRWFKFGEPYTTIDCPTTPAHFPQYSVNSHCQLRSTLVLIRKKRNMNCQPCIFWTTYCTSTVAPNFKGSFCPLQMEETTAPNISEDKPLFFLFQGISLGEGCLLLTKIDKEGGHGLVPGHVNQASAQTEMWEYQQCVLHNTVDVADVLLGKRVEKHWNNRRTSWNRNVLEVLTIYRSGQTFLQLFILASKVVKFPSCSNDISHRLY